MCEVQIILLHQSGFVVLAAGTMASCEVAFWFGAIVGIVGEEVIVRGIDCSFHVLSILIIIIRR